MSVKYWFLLLVIYIMVNKDTENFFKKKVFNSFQTLKNWSDITVWSWTAENQISYMYTGTKHHMTIHVYSAFRQWCTVLTVATLASSFSSKSFMRVFMYPILASRSVMARVLASFCSFIIPRTSLFNWSDKIPIVHAVGY